jgi:hypothetical protein
LRLDFNVLWVDDQPKNIKSSIERLESELEAEGFKLRPTICAKAADVGDKVKDNVFSDEIDLILVDWDLDAGNKGEDILKQVRNTARYKDIVFYSARKPVAELRKVAFDINLDGIFFSNRESLVDDVLGVFRALMRKVMDVHHTRGLVMAATSDIDQMVHRGLVKTYDLHDPEGQTKMMQHMLDALKNRETSAAEQLKKVMKEKGFSDALGEAKFLSASDKLIILIGNLKRPEDEEMKKLLSSYRDDTIRKRNKLGHLPLKPGSEPDTVVDNEGNVHTLADMRSLRRAMLRVREEVDGWLLKLENLTK